MENAALPGTAAKSVARLGKVVAAAMDIGSLSRSGVDEGSRRCIPETNLIGGHAKALLTHKR